MMRTPSWLVGCVAIFAVAVIPAARAESPTVAGLCVAAGVAGAPPVIVPLESTEVVLDVQAGLLEAEVIQTFTNHTDTALEATYLFPLPHDATLSDFELRYGDRVVQSVVREKAVARAEYEAAREAGRKAALLEQADPSLFSTAVANFLPGETVRVVIRFVQPLSFNADAIDVRFPMVTGDKYFPADSPPGTPGNAAPNPQRLAAEAVAPGHVYAFDIQVAGIPVQEITSSSHQIRAGAQPDGRWFVTLADEITIPDRDLVLRIATRSTTRTQPTLVTQHTATGDYGQLTLFPPMTRQISDRGGLPRDILFIIDCSGSMSGDRLASAKLGLEGCLASMVAEDRFQILAFADQHEFYAPAFTAATPAAIAAATQYTRELQVMGGTEMQPALQAGLAAFAADARQHIVILLTDGDVGNARSLVRLVRRSLGRARLFTFGIGDAPNAFLLRKIAAIGRGQARFIDDALSIEHELCDLFTTLEAPVLADVRYALLDAKRAPVKMVGFPEALPDLFVGRPLQTTFRCDDAVIAFVRVEAREDDVAVAYEFPVSPTALRGTALEKQFGRARYAQLEDAWQQAGTPEEQAARQEAMRATALEYQLVTELTSRVAIAPEVARTPAAPLASVNVAQNLPGDHVISVNGEDTVVLSAFTVEAAEDSESYRATATLAGSRLRTDLKDVGGSINFITRALLDDLAVTELETLAAYLTEPVQDPRWARPGADVGLVDNLPITTIVDAAMVDRLTWRSLAPAWSTTDQRRAERNCRNTLTTRLADEGFVAATVDATFNPGDDEHLAITTIFDWSHPEHEQRSAYVDARWLGETLRLRTNLQARSLASYGRLLVARAGAEWRWGNAWQLEVNLATHELVRDDPRHFRLGSPAAEYGGLGLFNLDLLTAETRRLRDRLATVGLGGSVDAGWGFHSWGVRAGWHRQESDWSASGLHSRENQDLNLGYSGSFADRRVRVQGHLGWARHSFGSRIATSRAGGALTVDITSALSLVAGAGHDEVLPWLPVEFGAAESVEKRDGGQIGLEMTAWDDRLTAGVSWFRDRVDGFTSRDWAEEQRALDAAGVPGAIRYVRWERFARAGWMGRIEAIPTRSVIVRATWYVDAKNEGPQQGGNHRGSWLARYTFRDGGLKGVFLGAGLRYQNTLRFADGFVVPGGVREDFFVGYESGNGGGTRVQLNLGNLGGDVERVTRFAPERGRQFMLTVVREF